MTDPTIVMVTTVKGRLGHLSQTLPQNLANNVDYANVKFVVLDYGDQDGVAEYIQHAHQQNIQSGRLVYYRYNTLGSFHVSHAKNIAARCGILEGADILVTLDADNFTGPGFAQFIADKFKETRSPGIFLCPDFPLIHSLPHGPLRPTRGYAGRLAIRAQDFIKLGGYDETFDTWHGEDIDLITRLQNLDYTMRHIDNKYLNTIPHTAEVRFKEYPHAQQYENKQEIKVLTARTDTIVNYGKLGLGTVYRNFNYHRIELVPIPTRIFGIGMHKTATTSLHRAFQILGFDSLHWGTGEAPQIWHQMSNLGRSKTLEQQYALSDLPIPLLYQKLDQVYPGSKFILTLRNEKDWLRSVSHLWDAKYNPTRWVWDVYPFSNRIHSELYGQKHFDADVFLERYRRHNAEVIEYFKDRPDDLLVMDQSNMGWPALCTFLKIGSIPSVPYPTKNETASSRKLTNTEYELWAKSWGTYCDPDDKKPAEGVYETRRDFPTVPTIPQTTAEAPQETSQEAPQTPPSEVHQQTSRVPNEGRTEPEVDKDSIVVTSTRTVTIPGTATVTEIVKEVLGVTKPRANVYLTHRELFRIFLPWFITAVLVGCLLSLILYVWFLRR